MQTTYEKYFGESHAKFLVESRSTLKSGNHYLSDLQTQTPEQRQKVDFVHGAIGLTTEIPELAKAVEKNDLINIKEELGDLSWYAARVDDLLLALDCDLEFDETDIEYIEQILAIGIDTKSLYTDLVEVVNDGIMDIAKRAMFYNTQYTVSKLLISAIELHIIIYLYCHYYNLDIQDVRDTNTRKLADKAAGRYKKGFSTEAAVNRDLNAEKELLSQ